MPVGAYTREVLGAARPRRERRRSSPTCAPSEPDVKGIVGKLTQGAVDAGFVYVTDVDGDRRAAARDRAARPRSQPTVAYGAAVVKGAAQPEPARRFVDGPARRRGRGRAAERRLRAAAGAMSRRGAFARAHRRSRCAVAAARSSTLPVVAIFVAHAARASSLASLGDPAAREALWLQPADDAGRAGDHRRRRHAGRLRCSRRARFRGRALVVTLVELPLVLPPAVAGHRAARGARAERAARRARSTTRGSARADRRRASSSRSSSSPRRSTCARRRRPSRPSTRRWLEASRTLGAGEARTFARVAVPGRAAGPRRRHGARAGAGRSASSARR